MSQFDLFVDKDDTAIRPIYSHRTLTNYQPPEREFVEPNASDAFISWLFRYRCIVCKRPATEINEIIPRSRSKKSILDWKNRVTLCNDHHTGDNGFHHDGVTEEKIEAMQRLRVDFLKAFGREEYL